MFFKLNIQYLKYWYYAIRIYTLPLSISGIILSSLISYSKGYFNIYIFIFSSITSLLLQIISNFSNDYGDALKGLDNIRIGPIRMVQAGYISYNAMKKAIIILSCMSFISFFLLIHFIKKINFFTIIFCIIITFIFLYSSIKYTIGKNPYGYKGYGDLFVFIFFGICTVQGTNFLYTSKFNLDIFLLSISIGLLSTAVLNINNMRDLKIDAKNYKYTIPVKIGLKKAKIYHIFLLNIPIILGYIFIKINYQSIYQYLLLLIIIILIYYHIINILKIKNPKNFNKELKISILLNIIYSLSIGIGMII